MGGWVAEDIKENKWNKCVCIGQRTFDVASRWIELKSERKM
jgi:hypothetical protein